MTRDPEDGLPTHGLLRQREELPHTQRRPVMSDTHRAGGQGPVVY